MSTTSGQKIDDDVNFVYLNKITSLFINQNQYSTFINTYDIVDYLKERNMDIHLPSIKTLYYIIELKEHFSLCKTETSFSQEKQILDKNQYEFQQLYERIVQWSKRKDIQIQQKLITKKRKKEEEEEEEEEPNSCRRNENNKKPMSPLNILRLKDSVCQLQTSVWNGESTTKITFKEQWTVLSALIKSIEEKHFKNILHKINDYNQNVSSTSTSTSLLMSIVTMAQYLLNTNKQKNELDQITFGKNFTYSMKIEQCKTTLKLFRIILLMLSPVCINFKMKVPSVETIDLINKYL